MKIKNKNMAGSAKAQIGLSQLLPYAIFALVFSATAFLIIEEPFEGSITGLASFENADGETEFTIQAGGTCFLGQWFCYNTPGMMCIPNMSVCDGFPNCLLGEDEAHCTGVHSGQIKCPSDPNPNLILADSWCDGIDDCGIFGFPYDEESSYYCLDHFINDTEGDFGDAPDSTTHTAAAMTAYPKGGPLGVQANFPTVFDTATGLPIGPCHAKEYLWTFLGNNISFERDADQLKDDDSQITNINVSADIPDLDWHDDGLIFYNMTNCTPTNITVNITATQVIPGGDTNYTLDVWFDWNRDGDWNDTMNCTPVLNASEWAVHMNVTISQNYGVYPHTFTINTTTFLPWDPQDDNETWMRMTFSPAYSGATNWMNYDGSMNKSQCFEDGETEDYYLNLSLMGGGGGGGSGYEAGLADSDFGDAPDSTNHYSPFNMTAYPKGGPPGIKAYYPTAWYNLSNPGPCHQWFTGMKLVRLGINISKEHDADILYDDDNNITNLNVSADIPDLDWHDDGLDNDSIDMRNCTLTNFTYIVGVNNNSMGPGNFNYTVDSWFDWNRDGDWADNATCSSANDTPEWVLHYNVTINNSRNNFTFTTPNFMAYDPQPENETWFRITIIADADPQLMKYDGSMSSNTTCFEDGETEDYYLNLSQYPGSGSSYTKFNGSTTDFDRHMTPWSVTNAVLEVAGKGKIEWPGPVNASGQDFDSNINISDNWIFVNTSALDPSFNSTANITIYNLNWAYPIIKLSFDNVNFFICNQTTDPSCYVLYWDGSTLKFNVSHFTAYTSAEGTNLTIWDDTDSLTRYKNQKVNFYANYTNATDGSPINGTGVYCEFTEDSSGSWSAVVNMTFNATSGIYEYNKTFNVNGTFNFDVSCFNNLGYANLVLTDTFFITGNTKPIMSSAIANSTTSLNSTGNDLKCYANSTDLDGDNASYFGNWYKNGVQNISFNTAPSSYAQGPLVLVSTLDSSYLQNGQNWSCKVYANDGEENSTPISSNNVTVINYAPAMSSAKANSTTIFNSTSNDLKCYANSTDTDGDNVSYNGYWHKNGAQNASFSTYPSSYSPNSFVLVSTLDSSYLQNGQNWSCRIRADDRTQNSSYIQSSNVTVINYAPIMASVIANSTTNANNTLEDLHCFARATDTDGENVSYNGYWHKNGAQNASFSTYPSSYAQGTTVLVSTLDKSNLQAGQNWSCSARADDRTQNSTYLQSSNVTIVYDTTAPNITLASPANSSTWSSSSTVTFAYNVSDLYGISNCTLIIGGAIDQNDTNVSNNAQNTFSKSLGNGNYNWSVNCTDTSSNTGSSETFYISVSYTAPSEGSGSSCEDECESGAKRCSGNAVETCGNYDSDRCREWGGSTDCSSEEICSEGECVCDESWICTAWSSCSTLGRQTRQCTDVHSCGTSSEMPSTEQGCAYQPELEAPSEEMPGDVQKKASKSESIEEIGGCIESFEDDELPSITALDPKEISSKIAIPQGYEIIKEPFNLQCSGGYYEMLLSIPEGYGGVKALRCQGNECNPAEYAEESRFVCGGSEVVARKVRAKEFIAAEEIESIQSKSKNITYDDSILQAGKTKVEFTGWIPPVISAGISSPSYAIHQPANPSLSVAGIPVILEVSARFEGKIPARITIPYVAGSGYDEESIAVYISRKIDGTLSWEMLGGQIDKDKKTVSVEVDDIKQHLENGEALFAPVAIVCENCDRSRLEKVYQYGGSRNAVVLVHGLDSSPATFNELMGDFVYNNQPWQIWTFGYSSSKPIEETANDLAGFLQLHSAEYDTVSIVGHSLGGIVAQKALHLSDIGRKSDSSLYTYLQKVQRVVLIGAPNEGSPGAQVYINLYNYLASIRKSYSLFNARSEVITQLAEGVQVPRVEGVKYYVIAGTKPMEINLGLFKISTEDIFEIGDKNDGIVTVKSASTIGGEPVSSLCEDYWEIKATHTDIIDDPLARKFIEKILSESIASDARQQGLVGYNRYFRLAVDDCSSDDYYVLVGKKISQADICDPCNCGDGYCGDCENELTCPEDCGYIAERDTLGPSIIYTMLILTFLSYSVYLVGKYVLQKPVKTGWLKAAAALLLISAAMTVVYSMSYNAHLWLAYFEIAFIAAFAVSIEIWANYSGFNGIVRMRAAGMEGQPIPEKASFASMLKAKMESAKEMIKGKSEFEKHVDNLRKEIDALKDAEEKMRGESKK